MAEARPQTLRQNILRVEGVKIEVLAELEGILRAELRGDIEVKPHPNRDSCYLVWHEDSEGAYMLVIEESILLKNGDKVYVLCSNENDPQDIFDSTTERNDQYQSLIDKEAKLKRDLSSDSLLIGNRSPAEDEFHETTDNISQLERSFSKMSSKDLSSSVGFLTKKKIDLEDCEKLFLFKTRFLEKLNIPDLEVKHKAADKDPVIKGPQESIKEAELEIFKRLRKLKRKEIFLSEDIRNDAREFINSGTFVSMLNNKFPNDPIVFESDQSHLFVSSIDDDEIKKAEFYVCDNFLPHFVLFNDSDKFEYMNKYMMKDIEEISNGKELVKVYGKNQSDGKKGYALLAFGSLNLLEEAKKKLTELINRVVRDEVKLDVTSVSDNFKIFMTGVENTYKVSMKVCNLPTGRMAQNALVSGVVNNVVVSVINEKLEEQIVDVIVNSTSQSLNLNAGQVSSAVLKKAGPDIQKECYTKGPLNLGGIVESQGYLLPCKSVFHCLAKQWDVNNPDECKRILKLIVSTCLAMASAKQFVSIAFPPIGCGVLKMPSTESARAIYEEIKIYLTNNSHSFKDIRIAVYDLQGGICNIFQKEMDKLLSDQNSAWQIDACVKVVIYGSKDKNIKDAKRILLSAKDV